MCLRKMTNSYPIYCFVEPHYQKNRVKMHNLHHHPQSLCLLVQDHTYFDFTFLNSNFALCFLNRELTRTTHVTYHASYEIRYITSYFTCSLSHNGKEDLFSQTDDSLSVLMFHLRIE